MLTSRTSQKHNHPDSAFKGSTRWENCKPATKLQANATTDTQAIKIQAPLSKFQQQDLAPLQFEHLFDFVLV